ncbi:uncharacterized protein STEHIDRAFT_158609 [Stereum hirsutum FP-91666 SS1]|uniref:uncharacterized protein n=1 Tax=Stereum hirsutum (strain FP-91666) TaxID=721885 RepID=UPI000444A64F|nr:uncharacterized protein STEHIDRAFT_158609 [Stereum hirsutum FP-91666 SS1]EIM84904.1 hypothetical protein STEHIDRAFT_158609 [Stereum hirsutum FP-91666 SS1]
MPLLLVAATIFERGNMQPTSNETEEEQKRARTASLLVTISEKAIPFTNSMVKAVYWSTSGAEIASILALRYPSHAFAPYIRTLISLSNSRAHASTIGAMSFTYLLGALLVISGSLVRLRCF